MGKWHDAERVLAIDPTHRGFGFVVLEGGTALLDWGTRYVSHPKHDQSIEKVDRLIERYAPSTLVLEDPTGDRSRRCLRVQELIAGLNQLGRARDLSVVQYSRSQIRRVFAAKGATTKEEIAVVLASEFPELVPRLPPTRKVWMSEDHRMAIFDAGALVWAHCNNKAATRTDEKLCDGWPKRSKARSNSSSKQSPDEASKQ